MIGIGVEEVRRLSQDEGYRDAEIALLLGVSRMTIIRVRQKYEIPRVNLKNRKDKISYCNKCKTPFIIRRGEKSRKCPQCIESDLS